MENITKAKVLLVNNGPLHVKGSIEIIDHDGNIVENVEDAWFCRCGKSEKFPYCDGAHKRIK